MAFISLEHVESMVKDYQLNDIHTNKDLYEKLKKAETSTEKLQITYWYFFNREYEFFKPQLQKYPTVSKEETVEATSTAIMDDMYEVVTMDESKELIKAPECLHRKIMKALVREVFNPWYTNYKKPRVIKGDPKGIERIDRIYESYWELVRTHKVKALDSGFTKTYVQNNGDKALLFISAKTNEYLGITLAKSRQVLYNNLSKDVSIVKGGSVHKTTLTEVKQQFKALAANSVNKEYFLAVSEYLDKAL